MKKSISKLTASLLTSGVIAVSGLGIPGCLSSMPGALPAFSLTAEAADTITYYPKCSSKYNSIVDALKSIKADSSFANRKSIAILNGIKNYTGTPAQNVSMLELLKQGKLIKSKTASADSKTDGKDSKDSKIVYYPKCASKYVSIVDALISIKVDSSFTNRKKIAALNGYTNYTGTATQNTALLNLLKQGKLIKSKNGEVTPVQPVTPAKPETPQDTKNGLIYNPNGNISVSNKAKENKPFYKNPQGSRNKSAYNTVIDQFKVASNARYKRNSNGTYCNIFAWDVMSAMDVTLPHWLKNNVPASSTTSGAHEINVNGTVDWLKKYGSKYGWKTVSKSEAQKRANSGYPTIAIWKNPAGVSGHVMVVRPEGNGYKYTSGNGPVIAQAGAWNVNYTNVKVTMGSSDKPLYYTHD